MKQIFIGFIIFILLLLPIEDSFAKTLNMNVSIEQCAGLKHLKKVKKIVGNLEIILENPQCNKINLKKLHEVIGEIHITIMNVKDQHFTIEMPKLKNTVEISLMFIHNEKLRNNTYDLNFNNLTTLKKFGIYGGTIQYFNMPNIKNIYQFHLNNISITKLNSPKILKMDSLIIQNSNIEVIILENLLFQNHMFLY